MCAIVGVVDCHPGVAAPVLERMRDTMVHRGPDGSGLWISPDARVGFGHRRLAIIDLSERGAQPMLDSATGNCVVFNGEIYNFQEIRRELEGKGHAFNGDSDTEVLLKAYGEWGRECLGKLKGMFAFAIWNPNRKTLFLARDRAGEKPLFYRVLGKKFIFASELKALFQYPGCDRTIEPENLLFYFNMGFVPGDRCLLRGFAKLAAGSWMEVSMSDSLRIEKGRYWSLPEYHGEREAGNEEEILENRLEEAVKRQMVADVPVGILLSGGVDSSLVAALAARNCSSPVKTFTIRFPGHSQYDESAHARLIANYLKTEHYELDAAPATVDLLPRLAYHFDEPLVDSSMVPTYLVSRLVRQHCTVALGGDGGDELFAGYSHYRRLLQVQARVSWLPASLRRTAALFASNTYPVTGRGRNWISALGADFNRETPQVGAYYDPRRRRALLSPKLLAAAPDCRTPEEWYARSGLGNTLLQRSTSTDFNVYLCEDILVKVDRSSMANSLEVRAPFLYPDVIEFAFRDLPDHLRATQTDLKVLPKRLCRRLLPPEFNLTRKQGFSIPMAAWLKGEFGRFFRSVLQEADESILNRKFLLSILDDESKHRANTERLFAPVLFELWRREFKISMP